MGRTKKQQLEEMERDAPPEEVFHDNELDFDEPDVVRCDCCGGEGFGIVGVDWDSWDPLNGPFDGDVTACPECKGLGEIPI